MIKRKITIEISEEKLKRLKSLATCDVDDETLIFIALEVYEQTHMNLENEALREGNKAYKQYKGSTLHNSEASCE